MTRHAPEGKRKSFTAKLSKEEREDADAVEHIAHQTSFSDAVRYALKYCRRGLEKQYGKYRKEE